MSFAYITNKHVLIIAHSKCFGKMAFLTNKKNFILKEKEIICDLFSVTCHNKWYIVATPVKDFITIRRIYNNPSVRFLSYHYQSRPLQDNRYLIQFSYKLSNGKCRIYRGYVLNDTFWYYPDQEFPLMTYWSSSKEYNVCVHYSLPHFIQQLPSSSKYVLSTDRVVVANRKYNIHIYTEYPVQLIKELTKYACRTQN